jgi:hypothetical protein
MRNSVAAAGVVSVLLTASAGADQSMATADTARANAASHPTAERTTYLGPFAGEGASLHPENLAPHRIAFYGTDLGFTYQHGGELKILFGDSWATESYAPIEASTGARFDDAFGTVDLREWSDPSRITPDSIPRIRLGQNAGTTEASAIDPGHAMDLGKTPMAGFSNGAREFALFNIGKPQACTKDAECSNGLTCDTALGFVGVPSSQQEGPTIGCRDDVQGCTADTMLAADGKPVPSSGLCIDPSSPLRGERVSNLLSPVAIRVLIGVRDATTPKRYGDIHGWLTSKFMNVTARTVEGVDPARATARNYRPAQGAGGNRRVFLWGRPGFIGVAKNGRSLPMYFAYSDLPTDPPQTWTFSYYAGSEGGVARFSVREQDAQPLDLDASTPGVQPEEIHDIANQMSIAWVEPLGKWMMFYGGGLTRLPTAALKQCGVLELFVGAECNDVNMGNGAVRMRTADDPWGPWTSPQDVIVGGAPADGPTGQYGPGGALRHAACKDPSCAQHSDMFAYHADEYGFFYSANIIEEWIRPAGNGVDILWNASTWDPYRVVLLRTHIRN